MPFTGTTGPVVHLHGLTGSKKAVCESRLGHLYTYALCAWIFLGCSFNVNLVSVVVPFETIFANPGTYSILHGRIKAKIVLK